LFVVVVVAAVGLLAAALAEAPAPAAARTTRALAEPVPGVRVTGVERVIRSSVNSRAPVKSATATCPEGKQIVGGGIWTVADLSVMPTGLEPFRSAVSGRYSYQVTAAALPPGPPSDWRIEAFAFCADPIPGYEIVPRVTGFSAGNVQTADPVCPSGKRVLGSGARVDFPPEEPKQGVGLQVARVDALGGMVRTQARRTTVGPSPSQWRLTGYAICSNQPFGYLVVGERSPEEGSERAKYAYADCPSLPLSNWMARRRRFLSIGGAVTNVAPANISLGRLAPDRWWDGYADDSAFATGVENTPTSADWDFIVVRIICVAWFR
jgi:hypothetical protein